MGSPSPPHPGARRWVLGVDGGNSKTIALIASLDGAIAGSGRAGCSDIYATPSVDAALAEIERAVCAAIEEAGALAEMVSCGFFSLAGADWPEDIELLREELSERRLARRVIVMNDAFGALRAGSPDGTGVAVVCGTGAAIGARSPDGRFWHSSWWQEPQGSRQLAEKALRAVYRSELGIDTPTALTGHALRIFGCESVEALLHRLTARGAPRAPHTTMMTRVLLEEAEAGDAVAAAIVEAHGTALGDYALAAARRVGLLGTPFPLVLAGGVFRAGGTLLPCAVSTRVLERAPGAVPVRQRYEPAVGALLSALEETGTSVDREAETRLRTTMPGPDFFATSP